MSARSSGASRVGSTRHAWTRCYQSTDPAEKAFGAREEVTLYSGEVIVDELAVADAHPLGARPLQRRQYAQKFTELAGDVVAPGERDRFLSAVQSLADLEAVDALNIVVDPRVLAKAPANPSGIFGA